MLLGLSNEGYFLGNFSKIALVPPVALFQKMGVLHYLAKIAITFEASVCAKIFSRLCTLSAYYLEDNAICARVLLGLSNEGYFLGDF